MIVGVLYVGLAIGICSDNRLVVLSRRELAAFFCSPIAYIILFAFAVSAWGYFHFFIQSLQNAQDRRVPLSEPIVSFYILSLVPVFAMMFIVPTLTMRLLSEEKRTGTMEVLLTAPVGEINIVMSKFLAALIFFLIMWVPWGLMLVALRLENNNPLDYRPLLSFFLALLCSGASFLSMGLFFSSLTRSQIVAAILTFVGMVAMLGAYLLSGQLVESSAWRPVLSYVSFVELWATALQGQLAIKDLLFPISATVFWLFLTFKVLEARKWS
jgi:ABC-type transport system involved in multi-copper enzyme maturation permease subunit